MRHVYRKAQTVRTNYGGKEHMKYQAPGLLNCSHGLIEPVIFILKHKGSPYFYAMRLNIYNKVYVLKMIY